jgi:NAD+ kinase
VVVEEESPPKAAKIKVKRSSVGVKIASRAEEPEDEEEDESDEEDKYDIDDSSFEAHSATVPDSQPTGEFVGREKHPSYRHVMLPKRKSESRSRSRLRAFTSGFDSPGRFSSALTYTPTIASRHVEFNIPSSPSPDSSPPQSSQSDEARYDAGDDIRHPEPPSGKSRILRDHESNLEPISTAYVRPRGHSRGPEHHEHRAFAVWGHDESDSNASDCEA